MKVFISHSATDREMALKIEQELLLSGIQTWTYETQIKAGEGIASKVESALESADYVLVLLSKAALQSGWVKREADTRLMDDLAAGRETIVPILLDNVPVPYLLKSVKWIDFRSSFIEGIAQLKSRVLGTAIGAVEHQSVFELMYFFLLLDQFPNGIWGASLEKSVDLYGHAYDPGSISISTFSSFAITRFTGSRTALPIQAYRKYLQSRQSESGAFGMKRQPGTTKYPKTEILEHARHTATSLSFFLLYDGYGHDRVYRALNYLLNTRTPEGLWVDLGPLVFENSDPITVAFVIDALEQVFDAIQRKESKDKTDERMLNQVSDSISVGLSYIFNCPLRTPDGFWFYKFSTPEDKERVLQNLYQYTTDVISSVAISCQRLDEHLAEIDKVIQNLLSIAQRYGGSVPSSPDSHVPNLDATARLISTSRYFPKWHSDAQSLYSSLPKLCSDPEVLKAGNASGWSSILLLYGSPEAPFSGRSDERISNINKLIRELRGSDPTALVLPTELIKYAEIINETLRRIRGTQPK
jgi:TIR domain